MNELYHHGVKGMKWGVRRYQNKDGSLTEAGMRRYNRDMSDWRSIPNKWVREDLERTKRLIDATSNMSGVAKQINDKKIKNTPKTKMDLTNMTDNEMRDQINRALLEKKYTDMFSPDATSKGREHVMNILETTGDVLAIGSSALAIALAIKEIKG